MQAHCFKARGEHATQQSRPTARCRGLSPLSTAANLRQELTRLQT